MTGGGTDTSYRSKLDQLLSRYGRKPAAGGAAEGAPSRSLPNSELSWSPAKESWKPRDHSTPGSKQSTRPGTPGSTESPFAEAARQTVQKRPGTAGLLKSQVTEQLTHVTPEIERYYEYHRELYDFTFGKTKNSARRLLERGWRATNVPAEYSIPEYDSRLDPYCPTAWRKASNRPQTAPSKAARRPASRGSKKSRGTSAANPKSLYRSGEGQEWRSSKRAVYTNRDLLKHKTIRDFAIMPLEMPRPTDLIPEDGTKKGKRRVRRHPNQPSRGLLDDESNDFVHPSIMAGLSAQIEQLWEELRMPQLECEYLAAEFLDEPTQEKVAAAQQHLSTLQKHRAHTLEVLRNIQLRESVLAELHSTLQTSNIGDMSALMTLIPKLREHTIAVHDAVEKWRTGLWRPMPFMYNSMNYLLKMPQDCKQLIRLDYITALPSCATLDAIRRKSPAAPHAFVYLAAERPDKMVPEAQLEGLQAIEASILNEAQLQRQLEAQAAQLLAGGFISPTLRPISQLPQEDMNPPPSSSPALSKTQQISRSFQSPSQPSFNPQSSSKSLSFESSVQSPQFEPPTVNSDTDLPKALPTPIKKSTAQPSWDYNADSSSRPVPSLDLGLVRAPPSDIIRKVDGKNLRPRHKAQSPSGVAESSLSLNLSSVLEDKKSLFGNCHSPNIDEGPASSTEAETTDVDTDCMDDEVAAIMGPGHTRFKQLPPHKSPTQVPMLDMSQVTVGNTDSSGAESYSENDYYHGDDYEQDIEYDAKYKGGSYTP